jgi:hypothetical protein
MIGSVSECMDLRLWAKANRFRWRFEDGYRAGEDDDKWFVEVVCQYGLIYPKGGNILLAYANRGVKHHLAELGLDRYQTDGSAEVFKFTVERLDEVANILKPRKRRTLDPDKARAIGKVTAYGAQSRQTAQGTTIEDRKGINPSFRK